MLADVIHSTPMPARGNTIALLGTPQRVWAIGSIYGRYGALCQMHEALAKKIKPEDRIVYLGNYLGATSQFSGEGKAVMGELIAFRNALMPIPGFKQSDLIHLRGQGEDLCRQMLRLPFQKNANAWAAWAMECGLGAYLAAYDVNPQALIDAANTGPFVANRFTYYWKKIVSGYGEHEEFYKCMFDAAHTEHDRPLAFVPAGFDQRLALGAQHDSLCWPEEDIAPLGRYFNYARVVRGAGPVAVVDKPNFVLTLDGGNKLDGVLYATCLDADGKIIESLTF